MLPEPLHPAVVHFPIVLAVLLPFFMIGALIAVRRGARPKRAWALPAGLALLLLMSTYVAVKTGEAQEEIVESVVAERVIHEHEEAAEGFLIAVGILTLIGGAGLVRGRVGQVARGIALAGSLAVLVMGARVGHSGGEMVFKHGAASAYVSGGVAAAGEVGDGVKVGRERELEDEH